MKPLATQFVVLVFTVSSALWAESYTGGANNNPFQNANPTSKLPQVRPGDSGFFGSTSNIIDNSVGNSQNGQEYKLQDAQRQANAGVGAAIAAGTALTAASMRQMALLNIPEASRLAALASLEFAQAAASAATANQNSGGRGTLLAEGGQTGSQGNFDPNAIAEVLMTDENRRVLESQGINPERYLQSLTNGQLRTPEAVAAATGQPYVPQEMTFGEGEVPTFQGYNFGPAEELGEAMREELGTDDSVIGTGGGGGGDGATSGTITMGNPTQPAPAPGNHNGTSLSVPWVAQGARGAAGTKKGLELAPDAARGLASYSSLTIGSKVSEEAGMPSRSDLLQIGVEKPRRGQNIFGVAKRNYRGFAKWRTTRVARHN